MSETSVTLRLQAYRNTPHVCVKH